MINKLITRLFMHFIITGKIKSAKKTDFLYPCTYNNKNYYFQFTSLSNKWSMLSHTIFSLIAIVILYTSIGTEFLVDTANITLFKNNSFINDVANILLLILPVSVIILLYQLLLLLFFKLMSSVKSNVYSKNFTVPNFPIKKEKLYPPVAKADYIMGNILIPILLLFVTLFINTIFTKKIYIELIYYTLALLVGLSLGHVVYILFIPAEYIIIIKKSKSYGFYSLTSMN